MVAMTKVFFLAIQKIIKNRPLKKHIFFGRFFPFGENNEKNAKNEGHLGSPMGAFFDDFSGIYFSMFCGHFFDEKMKKRKSEKVGFDR